MRSAIESVLEYLVAKALADRFEVVQALYDYFVEGRSPSVLASRYKLSKHQIRGYVQRITEKTGSLLKARIIIKYATPYIMKVRPIVKRMNDNMVRCLVCGEELPIQVAEDHIRKYHGAILAEYIDAIVELMRRDVISSRASLSKRKTIQ